MPDPSPTAVSAQPAATWPPFSGDEMLDVIRDVYRPGWRKALVECEGRTFRTLVGPNGRPLTHFWEFPLYLEDAPGAGEASPVPYLDAVCHSIVGAGEARPAGSRVSPFIDWSAVTDWDTFLSTRSAAYGTDSLSSLARKERKLARDHGAVEVNLGDDDPSVLPQLMAWKSAQYRRTGKADRFAIERNREFYSEMARRGLLSVASLRAGGRLLAAHAGNRINGRFLYRLPSYDPAYWRYSPGSLLTHALVRASHETGDSEFDFLLGAEAYKFSYATHVRLVGELGKEPAATLLVRRLRGFAGNRLRNTRAYTLVRDRLDARAPRRASG